MITIREAQIDDTQDILKLIRAKAEFDGCLDSLQSNLSDIHTAFFSAQPKVKALLAIEANETIGIATYYSIFSTFIAKPGIWLDDLFVYPENRKSGAGKALITQLCHIAQENDCGRIDWIVAQDNDNGKGFYEYIGANIFDEVRHVRLDKKAIDSLANVSV